MTKNNNQSEIYYGKKRESSVSIWATKSLSHKGDVRTKVIMGDFFYS